MRNEIEGNKNNTIFISWSADCSNAIAEELKRTLEQDVFKGSVNCFVSTQGIASGEDWYDKIKNELKASSLGIMCITKENIKAPWLYFEAGALVSNDLRVIPLLINCDQKSLENSPIRTKQSIQFYNPDRVYKMFEDIRKQLKLLNDLSPEELDKRYKDAYNKMKENLKPVLDELKSKRYFIEKYIYPQEITTMTMGTVYISASMSAITPDEYKVQQKFLKQLKSSLIQNNKFKDVYCPAIDIEPEQWEGITTAVKDNFSQLKQVQHIIVIYEKAVPTSTLVEIGYGIALCKNVVIFYKEKLPYMLDGAAEDIPHLHTRMFNTYADIKKAIKKDRSLFEVKSDE